MQALATYISARETRVIQELEKHSLTRITNAPAEFLIQF